MIKMSCHGKLAEIIMSAALPAPWTAHAQQTSWVGLDCVAISNATLATSSGCNRVSPDWQYFRRTHHTSSKELAAIANEVKPRLLVLYHCSNAGDARKTERNCSARCVTFIPVTFYRAVI